MLPDLVDGRVRRGGQVRGSHPSPVETRDTDRWGVPPVRGVPGVAHGLAKDQPLRGGVGGGRGTLGVEGLRSGTRQLGPAAREGPPTGPGLGDAVSRDFSSAGPGATVPLPDPRGRKGPLRFQPSLGPSPLVSGGAGGGGGASRSLLPRRRHVRAARSAGVNLALVASAAGPYCSGAPLSQWGPEPAGGGTRDARCETRPRRYHWRRADPSRKCG